MEMKPTTLHIYIEVRQQKQKKRLQKNIDYKNISIWDSKILYRHCKRHCKDNLFNMEIMQKGHKYRVNCKILTLLFPATFNRYK